MSTVFRTLFDASTVKDGEWELNESGLPEWHELVTRGHVRVSLQPIAFLKTKEFSSWNIIED
jgi:hypothetical protein